MPPARGNKLQRTRLFLARVLFYPNFSWMNQLLLYPKLLLQLYFTHAYTWHALILGADLKLVPTSVHLFIIGEGTDWSTAWPSLDIPLVFSFLSLFRSSLLPALVSLFFLSFSLLLLLCLGQTARLPSVVDSCPAAHLGRQAAWNAAGECGRPAQRSVTREN